MNKNEPTRAWFAMFSLTAIALAVPLTCLSLLLSGIYNEPGYSDGTISSPTEIVFLVTAICVPLGVTLSVIMTQWKRSVAWGVFGVIISLVPALLAAIAMVISSISKVLFSGV